MNVPLNAQGVSDTELQKSSCTSHDNLLKTRKTQLLSNCRVQTAVFTRRGAHTMPHYVPKTHCLCNMVLLVLANSRWYYSFGNYYKKNNVSPTIPYRYE